MTIAEIYNYIRASYGDTQNPTFDFLENGVLSKRCDEIVAALRERGLNVVDTTDFNTDVCRYLAVEWTGGGCALLLSLVGPYALVASVADRLIPQDRAEASSLPQTAMIMHEHDRRHVTLLSAADGGHRISINLPNAEEANVGLFTVLFSSGFD